MTDEDNPPDADAIEQTRDRIKETMPEPVAREFESSSIPSATAAVTTAVAKPEL